MGTSTVRFVIIVALAVAGVLLIDRAFPEGENAMPPGGSPSPSVSGTPSTPPPDDEPDGGASPQIAGVAVGVYNGTVVTGLAGTTADRLERQFDYKIVDVGDTPSKPVSQTTVYFREAADEIEAQALAANFFKGLDVKVVRLPGTVDLPERVRVAVYIGTDYAAEQ